MTAIVGMFCSDGVVIGADSSMTLGAGSSLRTIEQPTQKIDIVNDRVIVAGTGYVGHGQRFRRVVKTSTGKFMKPRSNPVDICRKLGNSAIQDFKQTQYPVEFGAVIAFGARDEPVLCEFSLGQFQPELKDKHNRFCSMGSAQAITDPFLAFLSELFWPSGEPTLDDGLLVVTWTLDHAITVNPGGVNGPVQVAVLRRDDASGLQPVMLTDDDLVEHREWIDETKKDIRASRVGKLKEGGPHIPPRLEA